MTDHLLRPLAPMPDRAWELIDAEARERLTPNLAGRRLVGRAIWLFILAEVGVGVLRQLSQVLLLRAFVQLSDEVQPSLEQPFR